MKTPTLAVLTDCNDLDDQMFAAFSLCRDLIGQTLLQSRKPRAFAVRKYGSPDLQAAAVQTVLQQAEALSAVSSSRQR